MRLKGIPAYLERSRSGNGGHVWLFFEQLTRQSEAEKFSFQYLNSQEHFQCLTKTPVSTGYFPNQDFLSGKRVGNLIALPLFKKTLEHGNSCFIDADTLQPIKEQFEFLKNIQRISISALDKFYQSISTSIISTPLKANNGKLIIALSNEARISREGMTNPLINFLKEELNFASTEFIIKKKIGKILSGLNDISNLSEKRKTKLLFQEAL